MSTPRKPRAPRPVRLEPAVESADSEFAWRDTATDPPSHGELAAAELICEATPDGSRWRAKRA